MIEKPQYQILSKEWIENQQAHRDAHILYNFGYRQEVTKAMMGRFDA